MTKWGRKESIIWPHTARFIRTGRIRIVVLAGLFLTVGSPSQTAPTALHAHLHPIERCRSNRNEPRDNYRCSWWALAEINRVSRRTRRDGRHDAATGGKPIPLALSQPPCNAATLFFTWTEQSYIDASWCLSQECVYGSDGLFDLYKLPLLSVCYHGHPAPIFPAKTSPTQGAEIRTTTEGPRDDDSEGVQRQGRRDA